MKCVFCRKEMEVKDYFITTQGIFCNVKCTHKQIDKEMKEMKQSKQTLKEICNELGVDYYDNAGKFFKGEKHGTNL